MNISINPYIQTNAAGSFNIQTTGLIVGTAYPDPATRFALAGGWLDAAATQPIWGGCGISENIPQSQPAAPPPLYPAKELGSKIDLATAEANLTGFAVFDQNYAAINTPQSPVPQTPPGGQVNFYRLGSGARIALEIDSTLVTLEGGLVTQQVSWDFTNQKIIAFATNALPVKILRLSVGNSFAPRYASATGFLTWLRTATAAVVVL
jgi:hypothetical protein